MSYTRYWAIFNRWYIACTLLYIRHTPCTCRIRGIGPYSTGDDTSDIHPVHVVYPVLGHIQPVHFYTSDIHPVHVVNAIGPYSTMVIHRPIHFYTSDIHPAHVVYTVLGHIQPVIHTLYTFIHQTYTLYMSYTQYWAIFNRWYIAYTLLHIRHSPCTCIQPVYMVLGHIQPVIHSLYTFIHQTFHPVHVVYAWYWAIFNRWYIACTLLNIRHTPCTCRIRGIGPYSTGDTWLVHFYTSDIHPVHVVYAVLGHIPMVIHGLYTFIHQTYTLYMLYTRYWSIFKRWYMTCTLLYIRHTPCTCRKRGNGPYSTIDT